MCQHPADFQPAESTPWLLLAEHSHRVANEYAIARASLSIVAARSENVEIRATLNQVAERLLDFSAVHRALQPPLVKGSLDLAEYLAGVCAALTSASLSDRGIGLSLLTEAVHLEAGRCWRVGLIVAELITNSMRHGFAERPGDLIVALSTSGERIVCSVTDDGRATSGAKRGRGSVIIEALAAELGGAIDRRAGPSGTQVLLSFPRLPDAARLVTPSSERPARPGLLCRTCAARRTAPCGPFSPIRQ